MCAGGFDDDDWFASIPLDQMVADSHAPHAPHAQQPHAQQPYAPPASAVETIQAQLAAAKIAQLELQLAEARKAAAGIPPQPPQPPYPPYPPYPPSAPALGAPAGEPSVRAARKLSTKRSLAGSEGADARATKQHLVDLT